MKPDKHGIAAVRVCALLYGIVDIVGNIAGFFARIGIFVKQVKIRAARIGRQIPPFFK